MTIYHVPSNIAVCKIGLIKALASVIWPLKKNSYHVDRKDVRSGVVGISEQKYSFSSGSTKMGTISSAEQPTQRDQHSNVIEVEEPYHQIQTKM